MGSRGRTKQLAKQEILNYPELIYKDVEIFFEAMKKIGAADNGKKICLELGMGCGKFLTEYVGALTAASGANDSSEIFLGIETKEERCLKAAKKIAANGADNVIIFCGLFSAVKDFFIKNPVDEIWINFPDPWPKSRQEKNRFINYQTISELENMLKESGILNFKTDNKDLFEYTEKVLAKSGFQQASLTRDLHQSDLPAFPYKITTEFEERFLKQNLPIYFLSYRKVGV